MRAQWRVREAGHSERVRDLRERLEQLRQEMEQAERRHDLNRAAEIKHGELPRGREVARL